MIKIENFLIPLYGYFFFLIFSGCGYRENRPVEIPLVSFKESDDFEILEEIYKHEDEDKTYSQQLNKEPKIGVILGPGLNRTLLHLTILHELENEHIPIEFVFGSGFSVIIAIMYAKYKNVAKIDWPIFKLLNGLPDQSYNISENSLDYYINFIRDDLGIKSFADLKIPFFVSAYNHKTKKVEYFEQGEILSKVFYNLNFYRSGKSRYHSPIFKEIFPVNKIKSKGIDLVIGIDILDDKIKLEKGDDYLAGVFSFASGQIQKEKNKLDIFFKLESIDMPLDSAKNLGFYSEQVRSFAKKLSQELKNKIQRWKEETSQQE